MNWDAIGAIAELLGAIAVLATLVFIGRQVSAASRANELEITRSLTHSWSDFHKWTMSSENLEEAQHLMYHELPQDMSETQIRKLYNMYAALSHALGDQDWLHASGHISTEHYYMYLTNAYEILNRNRFGRSWIKLEGGPSEGGREGGMLSRPFSLLSQEDKSAIKKMGTKHFRIFKKLAAEEEVVQ